ncbi:MAG: hypothetical protein R6U61_05825 [Thermoplasmata archaeon]
MSEAVSPEKVAELEQRIETLELMVDKKLREKIAQGLKDEAEGRLISLDEYEKKYKD